jgi:KUP system potassium uptake protein
MVSCIGLVLGFQSSSNLAAAYGVAVTMTMVITAVLLFVVVKEQWQWRTCNALFMCGGFLIIDLAFFAANIFKIPQGGWFPLVIGAVVFAAMTTWKRGREMIAARLHVDDISTETFVNSIAEHPSTRVPGTAVFLHSLAGSVPPALIANLKHNHVLHERVVLVALPTEDVPHVHPVARAEVQSYREEFYQLILHLGFMDEHNVPQLLENIVMAEFGFNPQDTTYFLGRVTLLITEQSGMACWRKHLFALMVHNARSAALYFKIPPERVIEVGIQIEF